MALAIPMSCVPAQAACAGYADALNMMRSADQALRQRFDHQHADSPAQKKLQDHLRIVDRTNTARLKALVARCGWPDPDIYGKEAVHAAWLLTQHADHDVAFQKRVLALIEQRANERGQSLDKTFAYLSDRIAVAEQRPQPYGTQLMVPVERPCDMRFEPLDDRRQVELRRAAMGLPPLDIYREIALERMNCPVGDGVSASESDSPPGRH